MFVPVWFTHAWSTGEGDLLGAYLHCTATTPFETVCKQFINGSVPFGYSLNSGFDTGNDSWFSSGAWQVGTPVQKMPAGTGALWVGESRGPRGLGYHFLLGLALCEEKKNLFALVKKAEESENVHVQRPRCSLFRRVLSTCTRYNTVPRSAWEGRAGHFNPGVIQPTQKVTTPMALNKLPASRKREDT